MEILEAAKTSQKAVVYDYTKLVIDEKAEIPVLATSNKATAFDNTNWGMATRAYLKTMNKTLKGKHYEYITMKGKEYRKAVRGPRGAEDSTETTSLDVLVDKDRRAHLVNISDDEADCKWFILPRFIC